MSNCLQSFKNLSKPAIDTTFKLFFPVSQTMQSFTTKEKPCAGKKPLRTGSRGQSRNTDFTSSSSVSETTVLKSLWRLKSLEPSREAPVALDYHFTVEGDKILSLGID